MSTEDEMREFTRALFDRAERSAHGHHADIPTHPVPDDTNRPLLGLFARRPRLGTLNRTATNTKEK